MKTANALDGDHAALTNLVRDDFDRIYGGRFGRVKTHTWPTLRAGDALGVEAAVARALVLSPALLAEREARHRGAVAVVGQRLDDREPRATACACLQSVSVPSIARIAQLGHACVAHGTVRSRREAWHAIAKHVCDGKTGKPFGLAPGDRHLTRRIGIQRGEECVEGDIVALRLDRHAGARVANRSGDPVANRQAVHGGAKPDALDNAADCDLAVPYARPVERNAPRCAHATPDCGLWDQV